MIIDDIGMYTKNNNIIGLFSSLLFLRPSANNQLVGGVTLSDVQKLAAKEQRGTVRRESGEPR